MKMRSRTTNQFKQTRKSLDLTQAQLAEKLGCSRVHISRVETGARKASNILLMALRKLNKGENAK